MSVLKKTITLENLANYVDELVTLLYVLYTSLFFNERYSELLANLNQVIGKLEEFNRETIKYVHDQSTKDLDIAAINTKGHKLLLYYFLLVENVLKTVKSIISTKFSHPATIEIVSNVKSIVEKMTGSRRRK